MSEEKKAPKHEEKNHEEKPKAEGAEAGKGKKKAKAEGDEAPAMVVHQPREKKAKKWNIERCISYARRFETEAEWKEESPSSWKSANAHGWRGECLKHLKTAAMKPSLKKSA